MLTLPELSANLDMVRRLADSPYDGKIAAVARFADEVEILEQAGDHMAVDSFTEAGAGFAGRVQPVSLSTKGHRKIRPERANSGTMRCRRLGAVHSTICRRS